MITHFDQLDLSKQYSYADYLTWKFQERVELIKGFVLKMCPAPNRIHQLIGGNLHTEFNNYLKHKDCDVYMAPFDVRLLDSKKTNIKNSTVFTVVQPDVCVVCDSNKLDVQGCLGAPDLVIEIISKGNTKHDLERKFELYQENEVKEYWIVFPTEQTISVFDLVNQKFQLRKMYSSDDIVPVNVLKDFSINLKEVFID